MKITYKGSTYKLKEEVAVSFKKAVAKFVGAVIVTGIALSAVVVSLDEVKEEEVEYQQVYISYGSDISSAVDAISTLNKEADYRDLVGFFEDKNDVDSASSITEGTYYVPVVKGDN